MPLAFASSRGVAAYIAAFDASPQRRHAHLLLQSQTSNFYSLPVMLQTSNFYLQPGCAQGLALLRDCHRVVQDLTCEELHVSEVSRGFCENDMGISLATPLVAAGKPPPIFWLHGYATWQPLLIFLQDLPMHYEVPQQPQGVAPRPQVSAAQLVQ
jgi:hypothetical protein